jgi:hypothetical protein
MEYLNKQDLQEIYKKCMKLIKKMPPGFIIFTKLQNCGWCIYDEDIIEIDYRKDVIRTAYHECVHYLYPDWNETQVIYAESRLINNIPVLDTLLFLKGILNKTCTYEKQEKSISKKNSKK